MACLKQILATLALTFMMNRCSDAADDPSSSKKQVIVVSLPGESDVQYKDHLQFIADFIMEMDNKTKGHDFLFVVHDKTAKNYFTNYKFTNARLIEVPENNAMDMWMRDFPPCMPKQQVKFKYKPQYLSDKIAERDEHNFFAFAKQVELPELRKSNLVLEGGNIVENGVDMAITTERPYKDNQDMTKDQVIKTLESEINRKVAVIPDPLDTTGHSDGVVSFVEKNVLLISLFDDADGQSFYDMMKKAVVDVFPNITIVPLPCYSKQGKSEGFTSSEGSYANSLVTNNAVYLPFFSNQTNNKRALEAFKKNTNKEIIPVYSTSKVPVLGGSLRCMTWQIDQNHPVAKSLFKYVNTSSASSTNLISGYASFILRMVGLVFVALNVRL